jgi:hypothetical protein
MSDVSTAPRTAAHHRARYDKGHTSVWEVKTIRIYGTVLGLLLDQYSFNRSTRRHTSMSIRLSARFYTKYGWVKGVQVLRPSELC